MTNPEEIKTKLGQTTEQVEAKIKDFAPYYFNLEPYQRGLILIALTAFLIFAIYHLTKKEIPEPRELTDEEKRKIEDMVEQRILKKAEFLRKLQQ